MICYCLYRKKVGESIVRSTRYEPCTSIEESQKVLEQRLMNVDFETNPPNEILPHRAAYFRSFPLLDTVALNKEPAQRYILHANIFLYLLNQSILIFTILFPASRIAYFGKDYF